jgi:hypothetical protein
MKRLYPFFILLAFMLPALACGLSSPRAELNNQVRLAVSEYARQAYGPVDDLVIHFDRGDPRIKFEQQHQDRGRTVWLYRAGAREYFSVRPPEATYLYIQDINYNDQRTAAAASIYLGDGTVYQGRQLTLVKEGQDLWVVREDIELNDDQD